MQGELPLRHPDSKSPNHDYEDQNPDTSPPLRHRRQARQSQEYSSLTPPQTRRRRAHHVDTGERRHYSARLLPPATAHSYRYRKEREGPPVSVVQNCGRRDCVFEGKGAVLVLISYPKILASSRARRCRVFGGTRNANHAIAGGV